MSMSEPEEIVHHPIIQQDIETALNASDSKTHSVAYGFIFGGISLLQNVLNTVVAYKAGAVPSITDVALTAICVGCLGIGSAKYSQYLTEKKPADELRGRLRARKKVAITKLKMTA